MGSYKSYKRDNDIIEKKWREAIETGNYTDAYVYGEKYQQNINRQNEAMGKMDYTSREYANASEAVNEQEQVRFDLNNQQKWNIPSEQRRESYDQLEQRNTQYSKDMYAAAKRGDLKAYESYRECYQNNLHAQEKLADQMEYDKMEFNNTLQQSRADLYDKDCIMRDTLSDRIEKKQAAGKEISPEEQEMAEKYRQIVKEDESTRLDKNHEREIKGMYERGESTEAIERKNQEFENTKKAFGY